MTAPKRVNSVPDMTTVTNHVHGVTEAEVDGADNFPIIYANNIVMNSTKPFFRWVGRNVFGKPELDLVVSQRLKFGGKHGIYGSTFTATNSSTAVRSSVLV